MSLRVLLPRPLVVIILGGGVLWSSFFDRERREGREMPVTYYLRVLYHAGGVAQRNIVAYVQMHAAMHACMHANIHTFLHT
jgi:hypothetical protein